jgi:hypothetical protein
MAQQSSTILTALSNVARKGLIDMAAALPGKENKRFRVREWLPGGITRAAECSPRAPIAAGNECIDAPHQ